VHCFSVSIALLNNLLEYSQYRTELSAMLSATCSKVNTGSQILFWHSFDLTGYILKENIILSTWKYVKMIIIFFNLWIFINLREYPKLVLW